MGSDRAFGEPNYSPIDLTPDGVRRKMAAVRAERERREARRLLVFRVSLSAGCGLVGYVLGRLLP